MQNQLQEEKTTTKIIPTTTTAIFEESQGGRSPTAGSLKRAPVTSICGKSMFFCKNEECMQSMQVAFHLKGTLPGVYTYEPIYAHYIEGTCGHILEDWTH